MRSTRQNVAIMAITLLMLCGCISTDNSTYLNGVSTDFTSSRLQQAQQMGMRTGRYDGSFGNRDGYRLYENNNEMFLSQIYRDYDTTAYTFAGVTSGTNHNKNYIYDNKRFKKIQDFYKVKKLKTFSRSWVQNRGDHSQRGKFRDRPERPYKGYARNAGLVYWIVYNSITGFGIEWIDYSQIVEKYKQAIRDRDISVLALGQFPELDNFIHPSTFYVELNKVHSKNGVQKLRQLANSIGSWKMLVYVEEKLKRLEFEAEYQTAMNADIKDRQAFVTRYDNFRKIDKTQINEQHCYASRATKLNVREAAGKSRYNDIIGSINQGDSVCVIKVDRDWAKIDSGWVAKRYLTTANLLTYQQRVVSMSDHIFNEIRQHTLASRSVAKLSDYLADHPDDAQIKQTLADVKQAKYENRRNAVINSRSIALHDAFLLQHPRDKLIKQALIGLYRNENTFASALKAYGHSSQESDLTTAFSLANTLNQTLKAEKLLLRDAPLSNIFELIETNSRTSAPKVLNLAGDAIPMLQSITETSVAMEGIEKSFKLSSKIPLQGSYEVHVNFEQAINLRFKSNLTDGTFWELLTHMVTKEDKTNHRAVFKVNPNNNYTDSVNIDFKISSASISTLGINAGTEVVGAKINIKLVSAEQT